MPFRATVYDVSIDAPYAWLATGYGVQLRENEGTRVVAQTAIPGSTRVVRADGHGVAYVASGSRLYVLRRDGRSITVVRSVDTGATVNDILIVGSYLFVGTATGLQHYDVIDPQNPIRTSALLLTSAPNVTSLAVIGPRLFAADGDSTVEVFSITIPSIPQHTGDLTTIARATTVHASPDQMLFVSDAIGQNTDIFVGGATRIGHLDLGTNSFVPYSGSVHLVAGLNRTVHAIDFSSTSVIKEQFEQELLPVTGTDNLIHALARNGNTLYIAAGDIGLVTMDISTLGPPYPVASYTTSATNSVVAMGEQAWFADAVGVITQQRVTPSGIALATERTWNGGTRVQDVDATGVLATNGALANLYSLATGTPLALTATFPSTITDAVIASGPAIVALLADGTVWKSTAGAPQQITLPKIAQLARGGSRILFVENRADGKTVLHTVTDVAQTPATYIVDGVSIGRVAVDANRAALFVFNGITIVDLATGNQRAIAGSTDVIPQQLAFQGDDLVALADRSLRVYDDARTLVREQYLPTSANAVAVQGNIAFMASSDGTMAALTTAQQPAVKSPFRNATYSKVVAGGERVYLLSQDGIDIYSTAFSNAPRYSSGVPATGIVDVAASAGSFFTVSASGVVSAYSQAGVRTAQMTLNEGSDSQPLAIHVAGNAVWVSLSKGCTTSACEKKTLILDPATLATTASLNGGATDVVTNGTRAYTLFDLPAETRVLDIADPLHPAQLVAANAPENATSIAATSGKVYVAADKVYQYAETTLLQQTTHLPAVTPDKAQRMRIEGTCAVLTPRSANPELYDAATMAAAPSFEVPANVRSIAQQPGRLLLLTTHSLEVWSSAVTQEPTKRRATR